MLTTISTAATASITAADAHDTTTAATAPANANAVAHTGKYKSLILDTTLGRAIPKEISPRMIKRGNTPRHTPRTSPRGSPKRVLSKSPVNQVRCSTTLAMLLLYCC
jgi:hypothetical protein